MKIYRSFCQAIICGVVMLMAQLVFADTVTDAGELALPEVPDSLRTPSERADYVMSHFWDAMEWGDTARVNDEKWMEQTFVNFASLIPYASSQEAIGRAFGVLFDRAANYKSGYKLLLNLADRYLYEPESPMYDEQAYVTVLDAVLADSVLDPVLLTRYRYQLDETKKNRQGEPANDFALTLVSGEESTLYNILKGSDETLVMFYDPECDHCHEVIQSLVASPDVKSRIKSGAMKILAVYFEGEEAMLPQVRQIIPDGWVSAYTPGNVIEEQELYAIRRLPTLYLIDSKGTVKGKDINPEKLLN